MKADRSAHPKEAKISEAPNTTPSAHETLLINAVKDKTTSIIKLSELLQKTKSTESKRESRSLINDVFDAEGFAVLHHAMLREDAIDLVLLLIGHGADPGLLTKNDNKYCLMQIAALRANAQVISFMLDRFPLQCFQTPIGADDILDKVSRNNHITDKQRAALQNRIQLIKYLFNPTSFSRDGVQSFYKKNPTMFMNTICSLLNQSTLDDVTKEILAGHLRIGIQSQFEFKTEFSEKHKAQCTYKFDALTDDTVIIVNYLQCGGNPTQLHLLELFSKYPQKFLHYMDAAINSDDCYTRHFYAIGEILIQALQKTDDERLKDKIHFQLTKLFYNYYLQNRTKNFKYYISACLECGRIKNPANLRKEENDFLVENILDASSRNYLSGMSYFEQEHRIAKHEKPVDAKEDKEVEAQRAELHKLGWQELNNCMTQFLKHLLRTNSFWIEAKDDKDHSEAQPNDAHDLFLQLSLLKKQAEKNQATRGHELNMLQAKIKNLLKPKETHTFFKAYIPDAAVMVILSNMQKTINAIRVNIEKAPPRHTS